MYGLLLLGNCAWTSSCVRRVEIHPLLGASGGFPTVIFSSFKKIGFLSWTKVLFSKYIKNEGGHQVAFLLLDIQLPILFYAFLSQAKLQYGQGSIVKRSFSNVLSLPLGHGQIQLDLWQGLRKKPCS